MNETPNLKNVPDEIQRLARAWSTVLYKGTPEANLVKADLEAIRDRSSHTANDPYTTAYKEGERSLATGILRLAEVFQGE